MDSEALLLIGAILVFCGFLAVAWWPPQLAPRRYTVTRSDGTTEYRFL